jgi:hypothetical protein
MQNSYQYDIFLSYRRLGRVHEWIEKIFLPEMHGLLQLEFAREPRIFWDDHALQEGDMPIGLVPAH